MTIEVLRRRGLTPLAAGGAGSAGRLASGGGAIPSLITGKLANGVSWFEDFHSVATGNIGWASGLTATPDTLVNLAPLGNPPWAITESSTNANGTGGTSPSGIVGDVGTGCMNLQSGTSNPSSLVCDAYGRAATSSGNFLNCAVGVASFIGMTRFAFNGTSTSSIRGAGWINSGVLATDWMTDPDTTLAAGLGAASLVVTRHTASYSGDAAGDVVLRWYGGAADADSTSVVLTSSASFSAAHFYKLEIAYVAGASTLAVYFDGVLVATLNCPDFLVTSTPMRPSFGAVTLTTSTRQIVTDCYYHEHSQATAR